MPNGPIYPERRSFSPKNWGWEDLIYNGKYCSKILFIKNSHKTSFHHHKEKDKVIYVQSGMIEIIFNDKDNETKAGKHLMNAGDAFRIKPGLRHRLVAITDAYIFETSSHHQDEDVFRVSQES
jgi:hypothetical protein